MKNQLEGLLKKAKAEHKKAHAVYTAARQEAAAAKTAMQEAKAVAGETANQLAALQRALGDL